ncbi:hypothetical protein Ahy_B10g101842 [Arachis hypogaea]|uniref:Aminotransferase-like plant mobile domain-containing protein n=1 Tax=Arachis hypogaea TaxID=3818 RepID=A0A444X0G7_ARAHY|nr:hypothetical protein Ahy_B10g101842 [Arachis hypogaea]
MGDDPERLYRLDGVAHIAGVINDERFMLVGLKVVYLVVLHAVYRFMHAVLLVVYCIGFVCAPAMHLEHAAEQGMRLDERYVPYLQMAGLYHLARLNDRWFRLDEPFVSAFVERWRPKTHTFHMPFGECTITLQDVARYVSGCLTDFQIYIQGGRLAWVWFQELLGVIPLANQVQKFVVNYTWFQETFGECPAGADEETVWRFARAYIMMLLGTQLFADNSGNCIHIRWLPYVARLEEMGGYSWGSAALAWLYRCMCRVANRHVVKLAGPLQLLQSWIFWRFPGFRPAGYDTFSWPLASRWSGHNPSGSEKRPRVQMWRLRIDMLQARDMSILTANFIWMPYSSPDVLQVVHQEVLEPRHTTLWRSVTSLIYFAVIEWHQIDRFGRVQPRLQPALNIDFLMSKDGRGSDRWFPYSLQFWHLYWESLADHVLWFDVVADPRPSHDFWTGGVSMEREMYLGDLRAVPIPVEATQRGAGQVPDMDRVDDVPDRWLDQAMDEGDAVGGRGGRRRGRGGRRRARAVDHDHGDHGDDDGGGDQHRPVGGDAGGHAGVGGVSPRHAGMVESGTGPVWEMGLTRVTVDLVQGR